MTERPASPARKARTSSAQWSRFSASECGAEPQRRTIVEIRAQIPSPFPAVSFDISSELEGLFLTAFVKAGSSCRRAISAELRKHAHEERNPSQTLSPAPCSPTMFMPSFQSPEPMSGRPVLPRPRPLRIALTQ